MWIRNDLFRIRIQPIPVLFDHIWNFKIKQKEENTIICHFLFQTTVLQYTHSRIHGPKIINNILIYPLFHFLLDPDPKQ